MSYALPPDVTVCDPGGRLVFLTTRSDRYLMVSSDAERSVRKLLDGEPLVPPDHERLDRLCALALLARTECDEPIVLCSATPVSGSFLESRWNPAPIVRVAASAGALLATLAALRLRGLAPVLKQLARRKQVRRLPEWPAMVLEDAAAFADLRLHLKSLGRCLPLSIALAGRAARHDRSVQLVMGVRLRPFSAHAWVQRGGTVLNDRVDVVRTFTPIFVL